MLDYLGILRRLNEIRLAYVVVGGVAVNLHGIPRMTYDLDLLVALDDDALGRLVQTLDVWGFSPRAPVPLAHLAVASHRESWIRDKGMKAFSVVNPAWAVSEIDLILDAPVDYETARRRARIVSMQGVDVPIIALEDLIRMKADTGRAQDEADIRHLRRLLEEDDI